MMLCIGSERRFKLPGYAEAKYREKFGTAPPWHYRHADPLPPTPAVRSWEKSRRIAYAKAMEAQRGAP